MTSIIMSFDGSLEDDNCSSYSQSTDISNSSHSMFLRSSCKSAICTAGEHCVSRKRSSNRLNSSCSEVLSTSHYLDEHRSLVSKEHLCHNHSKICESNSFHSKVNNGEEKQTSIEGKSIFSMTKKEISDQVLTKKNIQVFTENQASFHVRENLMARTLFKTYPSSKELSSTRTISEVVEAGAYCHSSKGDISLSASCVEQTFENKRPAKRTEYAMERVYGSNLFSRTSANKSLNLHASSELGIDHSDNRNSHTEDLHSEESSQINSFYWSIFSWRKVLQFTLSKPTHYDVELLDRIRMFGKLKTTVLLSLPLLLIFLAGLSWDKNHLHQVPSSELGSCTSPSSWWPAESFVSSGAGSADEIVIDQGEGGIAHNDQTLHSSSHLTDIHDDLKHDELTSPFQVMSRNEIKAIIQELLQEEIEPHILLVKTKWDKIKETRKDIENIRRELNSFSSKIDSLSESLTSIQKDGDSESRTYLNLDKRNSEQEKYIHDVNEKMEALQNQYILLDGLIESAKNCCHNESYLDHRVALALLSLMDENNSNTKFQPLRDWLSSKYVSSERLKEDVGTVQMSTAGLEENLKETMVAFVGEHMNSIKNKLVTYLDELKKVEGSVTSSVSEDNIRRIVKDAIMLYDADKTGQTDFALESGGGAVISTRCSETYNEGRPSMVLFGIPFWNMKSSPRNTIQPNLHPGQCWAFKGSQGYLVVELSATVRPTSFVVEHIPKSLSPTGSIESAPKEFSVLGLTSEKDTTGKLLGEYIYDKDGEPLQYFPIQNEDGCYYRYIELQINSNHGDLKYTCLYRFRVHGVRLK